MSRFYAVARVFRRYTRPTVGSRAYVLVPEEDHPSFEDSGGSGVVHRVEEVSQQRAGRTFPQWMPGTIVAVAMAELEERGNDGDLGVSFQLQQIPFLALLVFEYCYCSVLLFSWRSYKFHSSQCQRIMVPPEVVGVKEYKEAASGLIAKLCWIVLVRTLGEHFRSAGPR